MNDITRQNLISTVNESNDRKTEKLVRQNSISNAIWENKCEKKMKMKMRKT